MLCKLRSFSCANLEQDCRLGPAEAHLMSSGTPRVWSSEECIVEAKSEGQEDEDAPFQPDSASTIDPRQNETILGRRTVQRDLITDEPMLGCARQDAANAYALCCGDRWLPYRDDFHDTGTAGTTRETKFRVDTNGWPDPFWKDSDAKRFMTTPCLFTDITARKTAQLKSGRITVGTI